MNKTATKIDIAPILTALNGKLPVHDRDYCYGFLIGEQWYHKHQFDRAIDDSYVRDCVHNWYARGIVSGQWSDVLNWHCGYVMAMCTLAEQEKNS